LNNAPGPFAKSDQIGPIKAKAGTDFLNVSGTSLIAGDYRSRISRRQVKQAEDEQCYECHHWDGRHSTSQYV
jgi:hypothetical protein